MSQNYPKYPHPLGSVSTSAAGLDEINCTSIDNTKMAKNLDKTEKNPLKFK